MKNMKKQSFACNGMVLAITVLTIILFPTFIIGQMETTLAGDSNSSEDWISLFNGKDLSGWDGPLLKIRLAVIRSLSGAVGSCGILSCV